MKNITLSADDLLIERARAKARREKKSLNALFRNWLSNYVQPAAARDADVHVFLERLRYAQPTRKYSREEMNER